MESTCGPVSGNGITALILSLGEASTERAIDSVKAQSMAPDEILLIEGVRPFHRAMNTGIARVGTEFFVQVDADMVLDPFCFESLRTCMFPDTAAAIGRLRDPLLGRTTGIKMFRTSCCVRDPFPDSIAPDSDFFEQSAASGNTVVMPIHYSSNRSNWHTLGEHRPDYTARYTFTKFMMMGRRYRYRGNGAALRGMMRRLESSGHPASKIARIALARGVFLDAENDLLGNDVGSEDFARLVWLTESATMPDSRRGRTPSLFFGTERIFRRYYRLGFELGKLRRYDVFTMCLDNLSAVRSVSAHVATLGLCQGIFEKTCDVGTIGRDYRKIVNMTSKQPFTDGKYRMLHRIVGEIRKLWIPVPRNGRLACSAANRKRK